MDAYWAYSMRAIEEREEEVKQRGRGRSCVTDLRALGAEGKYPNVLAVSHAFITDDAHKGKGVGRAMYQAMMAEGFAVRESRIGGQPGPMFFIPDECSGVGNTSAEARRVWDSLVRDYPSQGTSIRVDAPPVIGSRMRTNPRKPSAAAVRRTSVLNEVTEKVATDMQRVGWYSGDSRKRRHDRPTAWDINNGWCEEWAEEARRRLGGEVADLAALRYEKFGLPEGIFEDVAHVVLLLRGKFYDAQDPQGVSDPRQLHLVRGVTREEYTKGLRRSEGNGPLGGHQ
jgi:predicted GNAT family acetyltransferase